MHPLLIELEREHGNLRKVFKYFAEQVGHLDRSHDAALEQILLTLEYLHLQPEIAHHVNEELIAEKLMNCAAHLSERLVTIQQDHGVFGELVARLIETIRHHPRSRRLRTDLESYMDRYERHLLWEEENLLPLAEKLLDRRAWATIEDQWIEHPDPVFGARRNKRFMPLALAIHSL